MWRRVEQRRASHHNHDYSTDYGTNNYRDSRYYFGSDHDGCPDYYRGTDNYHTSDNYRRASLRNFITRNSACGCT